jgi:hypothetical protein
VLTSLPRKRTYQATLLVKHGKSACRIHNSHAVRLISIGLKRRVDSAGLNEGREVPKAGKEVNGKGLARLARLEKGRALKQWNRGMKLSYLGNN